MAAQWVHLEAGLLMATADRAWMISDPLDAAAIPGPMSGRLPADPASTQNLLDGAIAAAERSASVQEEPEMTPEWWTRTLVGQWYSARQSLELMPRAAERFSRGGRADLAAFVERKLAEEHGHDELPLRDLRAMGHDPDRVVSETPPDPRLLAGVRWARRVLEGRQPSQFLGYLYAVERRIIRIPPAWFERLHRALPAGAGATTFLRGHALGFDRSHVPEAVDFLSGLPAHDRAAAALGAYRTTTFRCLPAVQKGVA